MSDVAATNADHESHEWHPKTKFIADILKGKGETDLVGKGHKLYHKMLIADILKENDKTKLISEGHKQYHTTKEVGGFMPAFMEDKENPCMAIVEAAAVCLISEGQSEDEDIEICSKCLGEPWNDNEEGESCLNLVFTRMWSLALAIGFALKNCPI